MFADLRYAFRSFSKTPAFTAVVVLTLALGIGANTAIFSVVRAVLLRPAPFNDLERLTLVWETDRNSGTTREPASVPDYIDYKARSRTFDQLAAVMPGEVNLTPARDEPVRLAALRVSHETLPMLGIRPIAGRSFTVDEDRSGAPDVAVVSESLAVRLFGDHLEAVGRTIRIDDRPNVVIGVVPDGSDFGVLQVLSAAAYSRGFADRGMKTNVDLWTPLRPDPEAFPRSTHPIFIIARLAPGQTVAAANAEMSRIAADLERAYPENAARGTNVEPLERVIFGPVRPALYLMLGAVALVLLIACVNVANLMIARNTARAQEWAVRAALGASRSRLFRQLLVETLLLTLAAAACGLVLAWWGVQVLTAMAPHDVPRLSEAHIDGPVLTATLVVSLLVGVGFGLVAAIPRQSALQSTVAGVSRIAGGRSRTGVRRILVTAELTLAVLLVSGAGLLIRSFWEVQKVNPGFRAERVLKAEYQLPESRYPVDFSRWPMFKEQHAFTAALLTRAAALPGIESVAIAGNHPLDPGFTNSFTVVGREAEAGTWPELSIRRVTPGYFRTVALERLQGRLLTDSDTTTAPPVVVINAAAARRFFADRDAVGAQLRFWGAARTVVGIVADEKFHGLTESAPLAAYAPLSQAPSANGAGVLLVRTSGPPQALASALTKTIHEIDPALAVFGVEPLEETVSRSTGQRRFTTLLLTLFAAVALLLAAIGVHGVLQNAVVQRRREIGIRIAVGARPADIMALFMREGLILASAGTALGIAGALGLSRFLSTMLFAVAPSDAITFGAVATLLALIALTAIAVPARRATRTDPVVALRSD